MSKVLFSYVVVDLLPLEGFLGTIFVFFWTAFLDPAQPNLGGL